jgi:acylphosphatase
MLKWCKIGPPGAKVINIKSNLEAATGEFDAFSIKY